MNQDPNEKIMGFLSWALENPNAIDDFMTELTGGTGTIPPGSDEPIKNRFAISALSREKAWAAFPEELLVDKKTGQMLIKDTEGNVVSMDKTNRQKLFSQVAISQSLSRGIVGDVYRVDFENMVLPHSIAANENILSESLVISEEGLSSIGIAIDIDTILLSLDSKLTEKPSSASIIFEVRGSTVTEITKIIPAGSMLSVLEFDSIEPTDHVVLKSVKINPDPEYIELDYRMILNDMILTVQAP